jgi:NodT family efflux transporter outer membrane factor (OMF) lipoprotein
MSLPESYSDANPIPAENIVVDCDPAYVQRFSEDRELPKDWWIFFESEKLNDLVALAIENSPTIEAAIATMDQALENMYAEIGYIFPTVQADFIPTRQRQSQALSSNVYNNSYLYDLYTAQLALNYTVDVFGGIRRQIASLQAQADSLCFTLEGTYLTLTSNIVSAVIQEAGLRGQIAVTEDIIKIQTKLLNLYKQMYTLGQVSEADVATIEASLANVETTLPPLKKQLAIQRDLIKNLAGTYPSDSTIPEFYLDDLKLPAELPLTLPSTLVDKRADVRAAEETLRSASEQIGVARANRLPNITLGPVLYGGTSLDLATVFSPQNIFWELAGEVAQTVFDGGTLKHREDAAWAAYDQAKAQYISTVLGAFQNVSDALESIRWDAEALCVANKAQDAAAKSLKIARGQFEYGDASTLFLLLAQQTLHQAEISVVQSKTNRLSDTVTLFVAIGGGRLCYECDLSQRVR